MPFVAISEFIFRGLCGSFNTVPLHNSVRSQYQPLIYPQTPSPRSPSCLETNIFDPMRPDVSSGGDQQQEGRWLKINTSVVLRKKKRARKILFPQWVKILETRLGTWSTVSVMALGRRIASPHRITATAVKAKHFGPFTIYLKERAVAD